MKPHRHLVSIIGVVTRGNPKLLVVSFAEHGALGSYLKKQSSNGYNIDIVDRYRFCAEIADGMHALAGSNLVHRDLAARNVLLGSGMVCKVADFGLSRQVQKEDGDSDYYRSSGGAIPVRWTAPEGLEEQARFSTASDVWAFGITAVEIFQDGLQPYCDLRSHPKIMALVRGGGVHPKPKLCKPVVYNMLTQCWAFVPNERPDFVR